MGARCGIASSAADARLRCGSGILPLVPCAPEDHWSFPGPPPIDPLFQPEASRYNAAMFSEPSMLVILWYPKTDDITWKTVGEWIEGNRCAFYKGEPLEECVPLFVQDESTPERMIDFIMGMRRHREQIRTGKAPQ
jgi:hypothetical protein